MKTYFKTLTLLFTLLFFTYSNIHAQSSHVNLSTYELVGSPINISGISDDLSGVTYNPLTNSLFMITNKNHAIYETTLRGQITRTIDLEDANDTEDIVHIGGTTFAIAEERLGEIVYVDIAGNPSSINLAAITNRSTLLPDVWGLNNGLEGVSYDPATDRIFTVKEHSNINLYNFTKANGNVNPASCNLEPLLPVIPPNMVSDAAAVHHLGLNEGVNAPNGISDHMLVLSQENNVLIEVDENCNEYSRLDSMPGGQIEGVTMDNKGNIYVVGEPNELYIYSNCRTRDSLALVELYQSTNGDNWNYDGSWDFSEPISTWSGVRLNQNGCVSLISLPQKNLTGTLPAELGMLKDLYFIDLYNNNVTGNIPPEMGNLPSLQYLHLNHNQLSGPIPPELGNPPFLRDIRLHNNQLTGTIPSELGNLSWLRTLSLGYNQLSGTIPTNWGNLSRLNYFNASYNQLVGEIPANLGSLPSFRVLIVSHNQLSGCYDDNLLNLCDKLPNWNNKNRFISDGNNFHVPWETFCDTGGCIPIMTCHPTDSLALVALYDATDGANWNTTWDLNQPIDTWHGIIVNTNGCVSEISLNYNGLTGTIPPELGNLSSLVNLSLAVNQLSGNIPSQLGNLSNLLKLKLNYNNLTGTIPSELGNLAKLEQLRLDSNELTGQIPVEIGNLDKLISLFSDKNQLSGSIPAELGNMTNLNTLHLRFNNLTGEVPGELGNLTNLSHLQLSNNDLSGCFDNNLLNLCSQLSASTLIFDSGNNFNTPWQTFCSTAYCPQTKVENEDNNYVLQNYPNPFSTSTTIEYNIPESATNPTLDIFDVSGKLMYSQSINQTGTGTIEIQAGILAPGVYHYRLSMGDAISATKRMVIVK